MTWVASPHPAGRTLRHNNKLLAKSGTVKLRPVADLPDWAKVGACTRSLFSST
jgi:hypothetical protein